MSNARNLANLLSPATAKLTRDSILDADAYSRLLMDASAAGTDVGDNFLLNATDDSATDDGSKILFEEGTDDGSAVMSTFFAGGGTKVSVSSEGDPDPEQVYRSVSHERVKLCPSA